MKRGLLAVFLTLLFILTMNFNIAYAGKSYICAFTNTDHAVEKNEIKKVDKPFSMVWFTDTQYYAESFPKIYDFLGDWFVQEYKKGAFGYVINTGDLVNVASNTNQWEVASRNLKKLDDANIPYGILAGNHDVINNGIDYSMFFKYFGAYRYKDRQWYRGSLNNNLNHYDIVSFGSHDFIVLYLGYSTNLKEETITWSNKVLKMNSNKTAILAMHEYLNSNSTLTKMAQTVSKRIVMKNDNVMMVLCGHNHGSARNIKTVTNSDGSTREVLEMMSNYQKAPHGGDGYLRYLNFHPASGTLCVVTYSPYKNNYNFFKKNEDSFVESMKLRN